MTITSTLGSAELPANASLVTKNAREATDPAHAILLGLLEASIRADLQEVYEFLQPTAAPKLDGYVIGEIIPFNPEPFIQKGTVINFPLLALYRVSFTSSQFTIELRQKITDWKILYVLGEMSIEAMGKLYGILQGVDNSISTAIELGFHEDYLDGYEVLTTNAGFQRVEIVDGKLGHWATDGDGIVLPCIEITLRTKELLRIVDDDEAVPLTAIGLDLIVPAVEGDTDNPDAIDPFIEHEITLE